MLCAALFVLSGCAARVVAPRTASSAAVLATPAEAIAAIRRHDARLQTMRARFTATVHSPSQERKASGVVLVKKPDRLRLRLWSAFGLTVLDYGLMGESARMLLPLEGKTFIDGEIERASTFSPAAFVPAFLLPHSVAAERCRHDHEAEELECAEEGPGGRRTLVIGVRPPVVLRETLYQGDSVLPLAYSQFREVDGTWLPFRVTAIDEKSSTTMQIDIEAYEVNPLLSDALFDVSGTPQ